MAIPMSNEPEQAPPEPDDDPELEDQPDQTSPIQSWRMTIPRLDRG